MPIKVVDLFSGAGGLTFGFQKAIYRNRFRAEFKQQIVDLYNKGQKCSELIKEYDLTPSTFDKWIKRAKTTDSFKTGDNLTDEL